MLDLISHVVRTSAMRDRTDVNAAMVDAMQDLFHPRALTIYRCFASDRKTVVFACAGIGPEGVFSRNAYLPDRRYCRPIDADPLLRRCKAEMSVTFDVLDDGANRLIFPVIQMERLVYLIDVTVPETTSADRRVVLMGLTEYFSNHIALLDYGETDTLTGLANRKTFDKHLFEVLGKARGDEAEAGGADELRRRAAAGNAPHWLAVCDIDHFKHINDSHGHLMGDEVLVTLSQLMRQSFRFDDQLFRFGGEEFIIVLQPATAENAFKALERFRAAVATHDFARVGKITVSVGYSHLRAYDTPSDAIDRADEALYFAKRHGRNQVDGYERLVAAGSLMPKTIRTGEVELFEEPAPKI